MEETEGDCGQIVMSGRIHGSAHRGGALIAADKFKGTLSSKEVGQAVADGLATARVPARVMAVADGGEGTARALLDAVGGSVESIVVHDPLGREVSAEFVLLADGRTAAIDASEAVGLWRLEGDQLDPRRATTAGVGELIVAATAAGAEEVIVASGGTATVDGGAGALAVLGRLAKVPRLRVACDVITPWERAVSTFGAQKGVDSSGAETLADRMNELACELPHDPRGRPMTGCGGGLSGGLWAAFSAELVAGSDLVLDVVGFDRHLRDAELVITGEGRIDQQTLEGKLVAAVARRCNAGGVPCFALVGRDDLGAAGGQQLGLARIIEAGTIEALRECGRKLAAEIQL